MIFMSQSGLTDPARKAGWAAWYVEHLAVMVTVDGIDSAHRFETDHPGWSPSLAMYTIASPAVFEDAYYQRIRGMGEWLPLIDRRFYKRNLFEGPDAAPAVRAGKVLLTCDRAEPAAIAGVEMVWLRSVGLDKSTPYRGIAVVDAARLGGPALPADMAAYRPVPPIAT